MALANGDRCGAALFDSQVRGFLSPRSSTASFHTVVESLYDAQSRWQETDFALMFAHLQSRRQKRAVIIVLSDVGDEETSRRAARRIVEPGGTARRDLCRAADASSVRPNAYCPIADRLDAARHAVAYRLLRERERTLHALRRATFKLSTLRTD